MDISNEKSGSPCKMANKLGTAHVCESQHAILARRPPFLPNRSPINVPIWCVLQSYTRRVRTRIYIYGARAIRDEMGKRMRDIQESRNLGNKFYVDSALYRVSGN